jgi:hypothetical protein
MRWERNRTAACETEVRSGEQLCERCTQLRCIPANSFFFYLQSRTKVRGLRGAPCSHQRTWAEYVSFFRTLSARVVTEIRNGDHFRKGQDHKEAIFTRPWMPV